MTRPSADVYFMNIALAVAARATCDRKHVGAVIVVHGSIASTGYNGAARGIPHCDDVGHELVEYVVEQPAGGDQPSQLVTVKSCIRTVHAEMNAVAQAASLGVKIEGGTLYTTASCCYDCAKMIINTGIRRVIAMEAYSSRYGKSGDVSALFAAAGVESALLDNLRPDDDMPVILNGKF